VRGLWRGLQLLSPNDFRCNQIVRGTAFISKFVRILEAEIERSFSTRYLICLSSLLVAFFGLPGEVLLRNERVLRYFLSKFHTVEGALLIFFEISLIVNPLSRSRTISVFSSLLNCFTIVV